MPRPKFIAVAAACAGALAIAACKPMAERPEPVDADPVGDIVADDAEPTDASAAQIGNIISIDNGALTDAPPNDLPGGPARKGWTYRHLSKVAECNIGVLNYDGQEIILTSAASSYPVACGAAALP